MKGKCEIKHLLLGKRRKYLPILSLYHTNWKLKISCKNGV